MRLKPLFYFIKPNLPFFLLTAIFTLFACGLVVYRVLWSGNQFFLFLIWNLFLAWIPLSFSLAAAYLHRHKFRKLGVVILTLAWLLFFPNAPYIVTDFMHFQYRPPVPYWYDLVLILSFAWLGLMLGFWSLHEIHRIYRNWWGDVGSWMLVIFSLLLSAFGIYLGRFLRWNSWDAWMAPAMLLKDIYDHLLYPDRHPQTLGVTLFYALFMFLAYLSLYYFRPQADRSESLRSF